jgi:hypothetical protein
MNRPGALRYSRCLSYTPATPVDGIRRASPAAAAPPGGPADQLGVDRAEAAGGINQRSGGLYRRTHSPSDHFEQQAGILDVVGDRAQWSRLADSEHLQRRHAGKR